MTTLSKVKQLKLIDYQSHTTNVDSFSHQIYDINNELVDMRTQNSWVKQIDEVGFLEFMEVQMINATAPFILCQ